MSSSILPVCGLSPARLWGNILRCVASPPLKCLSALFFSSTTRTRLYSCKFNLCNRSQTSLWMVLVLAPNCLAASRTVAPVSRMYPATCITRCSTVSAHFPTHPFSQFVQGMKKSGHLCCQMGRCVVFLYFLRGFGFAVCLFAVRCAAARFPPCTGGFFPPGLFSGRTRHFGPKPIRSSRCALLSARRTKSAFSAGKTEAARAACVSPLDLWEYIPFPPSADPFPYKTS